VWWRRIIYFATVATTLLLLSLPFIVGRLPRPPLLTDGRTWIGGVIRLLTVVLPNVAGQWVEVYADNPFYFFLLAAVIWLLLVSGKSVERRLRDDARRVWRLALAGQASQPRTTWVQKFRSSRRYQRSVQVFKWYLLPDWVFLPLTVAVFCWIALAAYTQTALPFLENGTLLCKPSPTAGGQIVRVARDFFPRNVCSESLGLVQEGHRYVVTFDVDDSWYDGGLTATPEGISSGQFPWGLGYLWAPFKRVIDAHYLQPLFEIRPTEDDRGIVGGYIQIYPLSVRQVGDSRTLFRADFTAARSGELFLFVNDAMIPLTNPRWGQYNYRYFYEASGGETPEEAGNRGSACVTIEEDDAAESARAVPTTGSLCEQAALRNAAQARLR